MSLGQGGSLRSGRSSLAGGAGQPAPTTSTKGWVERLGDSLLASVAGSCLFLFAAVVLWVNERRSAQQWALMAGGASSCAGWAEREDGGLVHLAGSTATAEVLEDPDFKVQVTGSARLRREGRIFQWVEKERTQREDRLGGSETTTTTRYAVKEWASAHQGPCNSAGSGADNGPPPRGDLSRQTAAGAVALRTAVLAERQIARLEAWTPVNPAAASALGREFRVVQHGGRPVGYSGRGTPESPEIGDVQVNFDAVRCGPTTVVALYHDNGFLPYRPVSAALPCLRDEDAERRARIAAASDDGAGQYWSCGLLCGCCNLAEGLFLARGLRVEIDYLAERTEKVAETFASMRSGEAGKVLLVRVLGWLGLYIGLVLFFEPFVTLLAAIPLLAKFGAGVVYVFSFFATALLACVLTALAYVVYRPLLATLGLGLAGGVFYLALH